MKIAILGGSGRMGSGLARMFARAGHEVILGSRDPAKAQRAAERIRRELGAAGVSGAALDEAAQVGELVVLAVPFSAAGPLLKRLAAALEGKVVVDITNPFGAVPPSTSGSEEHQKTLGRRSKIVAAFKTNFAETLGQSLQGTIVRDVFLCGGDRKAKRTVMDLIAQTGFRPVDCGELEAARILDQMVPLMIEIDERYGNKRTSSWKFLP